MKVRSAVLCILLFAALPLTAQEGFRDREVLFDDSPFSSRILPDVGLAELPSPPLAERTADEDGQVTEKFKVFASPFLLDTEGVRMGRITAGVASQETTIPFRLSLNYGRIEPDGLDHLNSYGVSLSSKVLEREGLGVSLLGSYSDTRGGSHQTRAGVSGEVKLGDSPFSVGADVVWAKKGSSLSNVDAVIPVAKLFYEQERFSLGADYTFENEVDGGEDDYSLELDIPVQGTLLAIGAGKNQTLYLYLFRNF